MPLFQNTVLSKYLKTQNQKEIKKKWKLYQLHFHNPDIQKNIKKSKEEQYQEGFLRDFFVNILGYTLSPSKNYNLTTEYKNIKDSRKVDGAIVMHDVVVGIIELKGASTTDLSKVEDQAFSYKNNQAQCKYVIISNFEKLRLYIDNAVEHIEFNLFDLNEEQFNILYICLACENIYSDIPSKIKEESSNQEDTITKKLYKDYSIFKSELFENLVSLNPEYNQLELFRKSQKLLDRLLFLFFGEDRGLLPPNSVRFILHQWDSLKSLDEYVPLYDRFKKYFGYLDTGYSSENLHVFAYNGGLFKTDDVLDSFKINDELLYNHTLKLSNYDFASEIDVNILGHIFENSLNELDTIKAELNGLKLEKSESKRKRDGVFYTPKYITKYIVENTIGSLCNQKKIEFGIVEEEYFTDKKRNKLTKEPLLARLFNYRKWLLEITIVDPACGSGAFLNEALNFLILEHKYIDELEAKITNSSIAFTYHSESILENNLFGVDLNEESVEIAKLSLWLRTAEPNRKLNDLSNNIKCGNSLIDNYEIAGEKAFNWKKEFPKIFKKGGFDIIIGNPPYGALIDKASQNYLNKRYISGSSETVIAFMKLSYELLNNNGQFSFIIPKSFTYSSNYKAIRDYLIDDLNEIIDCKKVWSNVKLEQTIFKVTKHSNTDEYKSLTLEGSDFNEIGIITKDNFKKFEFLLNGISDDELKIGLKIQSSNIYLNDISSNQRGGSFQKSINKTGEIKALGGANIQEEGVSGFKGFISDTSFLSDKRFVISENSVLVQNIVSHVNNPVAHIKIISNIPEDDFIGKVLIIDTINQIRVNKDVSNIFINELLKSKIINWYLYRFVFGKAIRTMHFDNAVTSRIPLPKKLNRKLIEEIELLSIEIRNTFKKINDLRKEFSFYIDSMYNEKSIISKKVENWDKLNFKQLISEINYISVNKIDTSTEYNLSLLFKDKLQIIHTEKENLLTLKKIIHHKFYDLYELTEKERNIINLQMP